MTNLRLALILSAALVAAPALSQSRAEPDHPTRERDLADQFRDPPASARPRVWWHWMNGNVTKDGIAKDLAWMKRVGIGGLQHFDANLRTPQIVDKRLVYMTPEWKDAFRFAATEADRLGLELAIASSPGWSETGGPWVAPADGMKKLVWSVTDIGSEGRRSVVLSPPPSVTGPFQSLPPQRTFGQILASRPGGLPTDYADVAVLAVPLPALAHPAPATPTVAGGDGQRLDGAAMLDDVYTTALELPRPAIGRPFVSLSYPATQAVRSATLFIPGHAPAPGVGYAARLEASDGDGRWREVGLIPLRDVPTTIAFPTVKARQFRLSLDRAEGKNLEFSPAPGVDLKPVSALFDAANPTKPIRIADFHLSAESRVDRFEAKAGFSLEPDYHALDSADEDGAGVDPRRVVDLTQRMAADGTLDWAPPAGRWRILRFGHSLIGTNNLPATIEATGLEVDKLDGAAVRRYLDHYLALYKDAAGADLIGQRGVRALLTDSIEVGAANWTPRLIAQFRRLRGYDPTPWLPALAGVIIGSRTESDRFLFDFRRTLADLLASEHYGTIAKVAHDSDLKVYGEALESGRAALGDDMAMRSHADVPMAALWAFPRDKAPNPAFLADMKGAASVAHIHGQNIVSAESMTVMMAPWAFGPGDLKRVVDLAFATGVNRPIIHTSVHVPVDDKQPGLSLAIFGQYFNRNESWAEFAKPWMDYIARNSLLLQQGRNVADVAYFYGEEAPLAALYEKKPVADAPRDYAYDFINADALLDDLANDGNDLVTPGGARYRALYLGGTARQMSLPVLRKLKLLVEGGATVVGPKPTHNPGLAGSPADFAGLTDQLWPASGVARLGRGQVIASADVHAVLARLGLRADFRIAGGQPDTEILFLHRRFGDGESYFLSNRKARPEQVEAHFRVTGRVPELWRPETGERTPVSYRIEDGETVVPLTLQPDEAVHVVFRQQTSASSLTVSTPAISELAVLGGPWTVAFQAGRGAPADAVVVQDLAPLEESSDPRLRYFSGVASYRRDFAAPRGWKPGTPLWLDLGEVREIAEVAVNGRTVGSVWHAPYRIDIGAAMRAGKNRLDIRVANLWVNRLIGDARRDPADGSAKISWTAGPTYSASAPLRRSGLIGPVRLLHDRATE